MSERDPTRLSARDDVPELSETLRVSQHRLPDDAMLERMLGRIEHAPATTPSEAVAGAKTVASTALKVLAGGGAISAAVIAGWLALKEAPAPSHQPVPVPSQSTTPRISEPKTAPEAPKPPSESTPVPTVASSVPRNVSSPSKTRVPSPVASPASEFELIAEAERTLRTDPAAALKLVERHAKFFSGGALSEEREVLAIEALSRLARTEQATARAQSFMRAYPRSAHLRRIQRATGEHPSEPLKPEPQKN